MGRIRVDVSTGATHSRTHDPQRRVGVQRASRIARRAFTLLTLFVAPCFRSPLSTLLARPALCSSLLASLPAPMLSRFGAVSGVASSSRLAVRTAWATSNAAAAAPAAWIGAMPVAAAAAAAVPALARGVHAPRTIRGVGPAPRVASFWKQPWLRRRLTQQRAKAWAATHPAAQLSGPVRMAEQPWEELPCTSLSTAEPSSTPVQLDPSVFDVPLRRDIVWSVVRWQRACRRQGTHKTKDRSEVFGSGKKARPQKGSGRARVGDMHAPHHKGGGNAFPKRPSDYSYKLPPSIIALGKRVALSAKAREGNLFVIDSPSIPSATRSAFMQAVSAHKWGSFLMVHLDGELDPNLALVARSNPNYQFLSDKELNVYDVLNNKRLVLTRRALQSITWRLQKRNVDYRSVSLRGEGAPPEKSLRFMVGAFGGGYTRDEIEFVSPTAAQSAQGIVPGVDVDGMKMQIKSNKPYVMPIHWP